MEHIPPAHLLHFRRTFPDISLAHNTLEEAPFITFHALVELVNTVCPQYNWNTNCPSVYLAVRVNKPDSIPSVHQPRAIFWITDWIEYNRLKYSKNNLVTDQIK